MNDNELWKEKFEVLISKYNNKKFIIDRIVKKILCKSKNIYNGMKARSKKHKILFTVTLADIRTLIYNNYYKYCKYDNTRQLSYKTMVCDHIVPISHGGKSTLDNIQIISKFSNNLKGSLSEEQFFILLNWLDTLDIDMSNNIKIRLTTGRKFI